MARLLVLVQPGPSTVATATALAAVDQRGYGDSDRPESGYKIPDLAGDVVAFLDAIDIDRVTLVGHSFGSFVAREVAIAQPTRVARLVLIGTGFTAANLVIRELPAALRDLPDPVLCTGYLGGAVATHFRVESPLSHSRDASAHSTTTLRTIPWSSIPQGSPARWRCVSSSSDWRRSYLLNLPQREGHRVAPHRKARQGTCVFRITPERVCGLALHRLTLSAR